MSPQETPPPSARLSRVDFDAAILAFLLQTKKHAPWTLIQHPSSMGRPEQIYLSMTQIVADQSQLTHTQQHLDSGEQAILDDLSGEYGHILSEDDDQVSEIVDPSIAEERPADAYLSVSYHIVFSPSYQVPVLYFNAFRPDGRAISLEEIYESLVPDAWRSSVRNAGLSGGISQQDHPLLNVPYFYMHPCETVSLMETILKNQEAERSRSFLDSYISTWLSFTGQAIGLAVPHASQMA